MNIETKSRLTKVGELDTRVELEVFVNGESCGRVTVLSGPTNDVAAFLVGEISWAGIRERWRGGLPR